ncbi:lipase [Wolfiporia cocos MD-104 SS10]|uniref:Lipase n=1 Tax=Wolfiporia cocos (strain MD-104) TaxID=742152 RepID=A0A2H3JSS2_WOLCO|nr:lipase [Wolfiporia cocos MD-104 SS10]
MRAPFLSAYPLLLSALAGVHALPAARSDSGAITPLTSSQIDAFEPYSWYASTGYCNSSVTLAWDCGANCDANPRFKPVASGGDGDATQYWFVGYDPVLDAVIVSHQGTDATKLLPVLTDVDILLVELDSDLFPGISSEIKVEQGFQGAQEKVAMDVLTAVQTTINTYGTSHVTMVGHSLGAAISLLDAVYLPLHITDASFTYIGYGLPRVGNQEFANYVDASAVSVTHINNKEDPVPILPGMFLGYVHPSGEVHIEDSGEWAACPGQDNPSTQCIVGDVPEIWDGDASDHPGPYGGVEMVC